MKNHIGDPETAGNINLTSRISRYLRQNVWLAGIIAIVALGTFAAGLRYLEEAGVTPLGVRSSERLKPSLLLFPTPAPTPQLSREYLYAGSRLLAVEDANANAAPPADLAVWRPSNGNWYVMGGTGSAQVTHGWGLSGDIPVPGDYDGDGKTDFSVFRPSESKWYIFFSSDSSSSTMEWGINGDIPVPGDYDGDGKTDFSVFRPSESKWYIFFSSDSSSSTMEWGINGDIPAPADYDGDGMADRAVWRDSNTNFYSIDSSDSDTHTIDFSNSGTPVSADYDGDGRSDYAIFDGAASPNSKWYIFPSQTSSTIQTVTWGITGDIAVPNDYDGDGICDIAVWRPTNSSGQSDAGHWFIRQSASANSLRQVGWGLTGDIPVPAYFRR